MKLTTAKWWLCLAIIACRGPGYADVVDFTGIPDGSLISLGNPYAGVLTLEGHGTTRLFAPPDILTDVSHEAIISANAPFHTGDNAIAAVADADAPGFTAYRWESDVTATFLQPVFNVSFETFVWRTAGYTYDATNGAGDAIHASGIITGNLESGGSLTWQHINLDVPDGYYLTGFGITNGDNGNNFDGAVWVDNISFAPVPEPGATLLLTFGVLGLVLPRRLSR
jgi:hypothetical protein